MRENSDYNCNRLFLLFIIFIIFQKHYLLLSYITVKVSNVQY